MTKNFTDLDNITSELYQLEQLGKIRNDIYDELEKIGCQFQEGVSNITGHAVTYELLRALPQLQALNYFQQESIRDIQNEIDTRRI